MKIATFNVNGINSRLSQLLAWLAKEKPDLVGLQELKALDAACPEASFTGGGYGVIWQGERSWNGVALTVAAHLQHLATVFQADLCSRFRRSLSATSGSACRFFLTPASC
ncbi:MAG: endonuclease/exonuclease/phosphatase family protein [Luteimonas sp.]